MANKKFNRPSENCFFQCPKLLLTRLNFHFAQYYVQIVELHILLNYIPHPTKGAKIHQKRSSRDVRSNIRKPASPTLWNNLQGKDVKNLVRTNKNWKYLQTCKDEFKGTYCWLIPILTFILFLSNIYIDIDIFYVEFDKPSVKETWLAVSHAAIIKTRIESNLLLWWHFISRNLMRRGKIKWKKKSDKTQTVSVWDIN